MPLEAGDLRERITIQVYDTLTHTYSDLETDPVRWAAVTSDGAENYRIRVRWRADLYGFKDTKPALRVLYQDRVLRVLDVAESQRHEEVTITAQGLQVETVDLAGGAHRTQAWPTP